MWQPGWEGSFGGQWIHVCVRLSPSTLHLKLFICSSEIVNQIYSNLNSLKKVFSIPKIGNKTAIFPETKQTNKQKKQDLQPHSRNYNWRQKPVWGTFVIPAVSSLWLSQREKYLRHCSRRADFEFGRIFLDNSEQRVSIIFLTSLGFLQRHSGALLQLKQLHVYLLYVLENSILGKGAGAQQTNKN